MGQLSRVLPVLPENIVGYRTPTSRNIITTREFSVSPISLLWYLHAHDILHQNIHTHKHINKNKKNHHARPYQNMES